LWLVLLVLGLLVVLLLAALFRPSRRLRVEGFAQVREGMTAPEVEALLGGPPGDYGVKWGGSSMMTLEGFLHPPGAEERVWFDDNHRFEIYFDEDRRVVGCHQRASFRRNSLFDDFRDWLGF
jgi:hypothetical protein